MIPIRAELLVLWAGAAAPAGAHADPGAAVIWLRFLAATVLLTRGRGRHCAHHRNPSSSFANLYAQWIIRWTWHRRQCGPRKGAGKSRCTAALVPGAHHQNPSLFHIASIPQILEWTVLSYSEVKWRYLYACGSRSPAEFLNDGSPLHVAVNLACAGPAALYKCLRRLWRTRSFLVCPFQKESNETNGNFGSKKCVDLERWGRIVK